MKVLFESVFHIINTKMSSLAQALSVVSAISSADITSEKVAAAVQETGVPKSDILDKVQKLSSALSSTGGKTRKHKRRGGRKTRKH